MKRNKILSLLLSVSMLTALTACGSQGSGTPAASTTDSGSTASSVAESTALPMTVMYWTRSLSS